MSVVAAIISLLKALPAVERLVRLAFTEIDAQRKRVADARLIQKDAAVDAALAPYLKK